MPVTNPPPAGNTEQQVDPARAKYDADLAEMTARHNEQMTKLNQAGEKLTAEMATFKLETALKMDGRVANEAIADIVPLLLKEIPFRQGQPVLPPGITLADKVGSFLAARPYYLRKNSTQSSGGETASAVTHSGPWDIERAVRDVEYSAEWKAKDPKGHKAAWDKRIAGR